MATTVDISVKVHETLKDGPFACTSLAKLSGGTANFVYRGTLAKPLEDGSETIVIKHTEGFVASNPGFKLSATRCDFERTILAAVQTLPASTHSNITIQTPSLLHFSANTQIHTDLPKSTELKTYLLTHLLTQQECSRLGHALGQWTRAFHAWTAAPKQEELRTKMQGNAAMRELKFMVNYDNLIATIANFPRMLEPSRKVFEEVRSGTRKDLDAGEGNTLIHGDFWNGNVLIPNAPFPEPNQALNLFIIDWELSQISSIAFDLGQMLAELFELKHFKDIDAGVWIAESFMEGYGEIDPGLAFKTAVHVGAHLVCWGSRVQGWGTEEQVEDVVEIGRDYIAEGWKRNREFFEGTWLRCLFA